MIEHDILCAAGCGTKVATAFLEANEEYHGDGWYGMLCEECAK